MATITNEIKTKTAAHTMFLQSSVFTLVVCVCRDWSNAALKRIPHIYIGLMSSPSKSFPDAFTKYLLDNQEFGVMALL